MSEKMIINANLIRKEPEFRTKSCVVEKAIAVSHAEFDDLKRHPLRDNKLIARNAELIPLISSCIMHSSWKGKYAMNKREEYTFSDKCIRNQEEALNCFVSTCNLDDFGNAINIYYSTESENEAYIYVDSNI